VQGARTRVGVLASQGGFAAHAAMLEGLGARPVEVRVPDQLEGLAALVIPGGESTTIAAALARDGLEEPIRRFAASGRPVLGTCAGMILCDRDHLGLLDGRARRNAFGRQLQSFEAEISVAGIGPEPMHAIFIRAPWMEEVGPGVEVLAAWDEHPVAVREDNVLACAFHPELGDDSRLHALLMAIADTARAQPSSAVDGGYR
jgi:pyridoxal 5'-phosphate synthase pdxT subunit